MNSLDFQKYEGLPTLFANPQRIAVAEHVLQFATEPPQSFTIGDIKKDFGNNIANTSLTNALLHMEEIGMLTPQPSETWDRRKHLMPNVQHPFWAVISAAVAAVNAT